METERDVTAAPTWDNVLYSVSDHVAHVTMNTPENHNVLTTQMIKEIDEAVHVAEADRDVHVIILMGGGRSFSTGHDISGRPREEPPGGPRPGSIEHRLDFEDEYYMDANLRIRALRKPTIAGLRGHVILGGLMTALMCDLVVAEENTHIWNPSLRHSGTGGEVMILPWEIGMRKTKEMLWTGDPLDVHDAERLGMINRVVPEGRLEAECQRLADRIALMPPRVVSLTKRSFLKTQEIQGMLLAFEHHFMVHQLGHAADSTAAWEAEAAKHRDANGFRGWLEYRDGPFREQAEREY